MERKSTGGPDLWRSAAAAEWATIVHPALCSASRREVRGHATTVGPQAHAATLAAPAAWPAPAGFFMPVAAQTRSRTLRVSPWPLEPPDLLHAARPRDRPQALQMQQAGRHGGAVGLHGRCLFVDGEPLAVSGEFSHAPSVALGRLNDGDGKMAKGLQYAIFRRACSGARQTSALDAGARPAARVPASATPPLEFQWSHLNFLLPPGHKISSMSEKRPVRPRDRHDLRWHAGTVQTLRDLGRSNPQRGTDTSPPGNA